VGPEPPGRGHGRAQGRARGCLTSSNPGVSTALHGFESHVCTELTSIIATNVRDKTLEGFTQVGQKPGTVGQPLPGIACRIVDPATLAPLPAGQAGTLLVTGPTVMLGYLGREDLTATALHDGWFNSGDRATMDEEGFITIR
jgi:acyl-[acyl-carrier-protein]-phospholipid O-acyltransferase/long-chain-fatty-acid--[acyl-carrier-protein] ligase